MSEETKEEKKKITRTVWSQGEREQVLRQAKELMDNTPMPFVDLMRKAQQVLPQSRRWQVNSSAGTRFKQMYNLRFHGEQVDAFGKVTGLRAQEPSNHVEADNSSLSTAQLFAMLGQRIAAIEETTTKFSTLLKGLK